MTNGIVKSMHPDLKNANIVTAVKKVDRHNISSYCDISLLSVTGKLLSLLLNRIRKVIKETLMESQCGLRPNRGTTDMIFAFHQVMEKVGNKDIHYI